MSIEKVLKISCSNSIVFDSINVDGWQHQFVVSPLTSHYIHCEMNPSNFDFSRGKFNIYLIIILVYRTLSTSGARYAWVGFRRFYQMPIHSISIGISHRTLFFPAQRKIPFFSSANWKNCCYYVAIDVHQNVIPSPHALSFSRQQ